MQLASPGRSRSISSLAVSSHSSSSGSLPEDDGVEEGGGGGGGTLRRWRDPFWCGCCCCCWRCLKVPEGLDCAESAALAAASSSSSSSGMVHELTMEADLRLALLELPELELELTEETVLMVEIGDMVDVRPLRELRPLSLLL